MTEQDFNFGNRLEGSADARFRLKEEGVLERSTEEANSILKKVVQNDVNDGVGIYPDIDDEIAVAGLRFKEILKEELGRK